MHKLQTPVIKICGITRADDAEAVINAGAQIVGLMFVPGSRRILTLERALSLSKLIRGRALIAGVFMDQPYHEVEAIAEALELDMVQLHGSENPDDWLRLGRPLIKRVLPHQFDARLSPRVLPLLDPGAGSGVAYPWHDCKIDCGDALIAGGLTVNNVRHAIMATHPFGVDVSSGVESEKGIPGCKDAQKIALFVENVNLAYQELVQRDNAI